MKIAQIPANEQERLTAVREYYILDTFPDADFDDITRMASDICHMPVAIISIIDTDRQWFKSHHGLISSEGPRDFAFCAHAINTPGRMFVVPDATRDERFFDNPHVIGAPYVSFYAGVPLVNPEGYVLGTLAVLDHVPNNLNNEQIKTLKSLARQVICLLELRRKTVQLTAKQAELKSVYGDLEKFSHIASHDLRSPLNNIMSLASMLKDEYGDKLDADGMEYINYLDVAASDMSDFVGGITTYFRSSLLPVQAKEHISVGALIEEVADSLDVPANAEIIFSSEERYIHAPRRALRQILSCLMHNAIQYNDKSEIEVEVKFSEDKYSYTFKVKDNGPGIAAADRERAFEMFKRLNDQRDRENQGLGLAVVKKLVTKMGGTVKMSSEVKKGTSFIFSIPK